MPNSWRKQLYILLALIPIAVGALGFFTLLKSPYTGINFEYRNGKYYAASIQPGSPAAVHPEIVGKEVVAIGDFKVGGHDLVNSLGFIPDPDSYRHFWVAQKYFDEHVIPGKPLTVTVKDENTGYEVQLIPSYFPISKITANISFTYLAAVLLLLMGLIVMLKRPEEITARIFFPITMFLATVYISFSTHTSKELVLNFRLYTIFAFINFVSLSAAMLLLLHFCLIFPTKKRIPYRRAVILSSYALLAGVYLYYGDVHEYAINAYTPVVTLTCATGSVIAVVHSYLTLTSQQEKVRAKWVLWGTGTLLLAFFAYMTYGLLLGPSRTAGNLMILASLALPLSISFAILKYRLMDIDTLFDNTLIYTVTLGLLVLLDMAVITVLIKIGVLDFPGSNPFVAVSVLVWTVIFAYLPVRNFVQGRIKRLLKREVYDANQTALELSRELLSVTDVSSAVEKTMDAIRKTLHPKGGEAVLLDENLPSPLFATTPAPPYQGGELKNNASPFGKGGLRGICEDITDPTHLFSLIPSEELPKDWSGGAFVPLNGSTGRLGYIVLQDKHSERLYDREDMKLLGIIASQAAMSIEAIHHREEGERRDRDAKAEKERITRDIHDGISSEFSGIMAYSEKMKGLLDAGADSGDIKEMLGNIEASSHRGVQELRNIISAIGTEGKTLDFAVAYIKRSSYDLLNAKGIALNVKDATNEEMALPTSLLINLIRVVQEACHNIIKHAEADTVTIEFRKDGDWLTLEIKDNGKGFDFDAAKGNGGHGLRNMEKRVKELGGEIAFTSEAGKGTVIKVRAPLITPPNPS